MNTSAEAQLRKQLNSLAASLSVLEHLVLAMFNELPNKDAVQRNFLDTTERSNVESLFSNHPESFIVEFEETRKVIAQLLADSIQSLGSNKPQPPGG